MDPVTGMLVATGAQLAGNVLTTNMVNAENQTMARKAYEYGLDNWKRETAYNSPIEQVKRLEAAGLNPNLAYGHLAESKMSSGPDFQPFAQEKIDVPAPSMADFQQVVNMQTLNKKNIVGLQTEKAIAAKAKADAEYAQYETDTLKNAGMLKGDGSTWPSFFKYGLRNMFSNPNRPTLELGKGQTW